MESNQETQVYIDLETPVNMELAMKPNGSRATIAEFARYAVNYKLGEYFIPSDILKARSNPKILAKAMIVVSYCFLEQRKLSTRKVVVVEGEFKPTKEKTNEPKTIITIFGKTYPNSEMYYFIYISGLGYVHMYESNQFSGKYQCSDLTYDWYDSVEFAIKYQSPDMEDERTGIAFIPELKGELLDVYNMVSNYGSKLRCLFHPSDGVPVHAEGGEVMTLSRYAARLNTFVCDHDHNRYFSSACQHVKYGGDVKRIHRKHIGPAMPFKFCEACGFVQPKANFDNQSPICKKCDEQSKYGNCIKPHNDKTYPPIVHDVVEVMPAVFAKDGLIYATNRRMKAHETRLWGVELELEFNKPEMKKNDLTRHAIAYKLLKHVGHHITIKEDGSLTMNGKYSDGNPEGGSRYAGFEVVTGPMGLNKHRELWGKLETFELYKMLRSWDTDTCGFHVHISRDSLTSLQIGRMLMFVNAKYNKRLIEVVAGRSEKKYTRYIPKNITDVLHPERVRNPDENNPHDASRRVALNLCNDKTVEFRIFRGTINPSHIIRNMEFCDAVCNFCYPAARSFKELTHPKFFIDYVDQNRKRYPEFSRWLEHHGFIKARRKKPGTEVKAPAESEDKTNEMTLNHGESNETVRITFSQEGEPVVGKVVKTGHKKVIEKVLPAKSKKPAKVTSTLPEYF